MRSLALATWRSLEISDKHFQWSQFNCSAMPNSLEPHGLQQARLPCPSLTPRTCSNSCPSSWWCHPTISSSVVPFPFHLQSFSASGSFPMNQVFALGTQGIGASPSVVPMNVKGWFPLGLTWTEGISFSGLSLLYGPILTFVNDYWKYHSFDYTDLFLSQWCVCYLTCYLGLS